MQSIPVCNKKRLKGIETCEVAIQKFRNLLVNDSLSVPRIKVYLSITTFAYHTKMRIDYWNVSTLLGSGIDGPDNYCFLQLQRDLYRYKLDFLALSDGSMKRTPPPLTTLPYYALKSLTEARVNFGCLTCENSMDHDIFLQHLCCTGDIGLPFYQTTCSVRYSGLKQV